MPGRTSVHPDKIAAVAKLEATLARSPLTGLVGFRGVPASALQRMRRELRERGHPIQVATNSQLRHAIEAAARQRPSLRPLAECVEDQTALFAAEGNPFSLAGEFRRTRSPMAARGGEIAPNDIAVPAQTTSFKPGPIVGELQHAGFPAAIEKGKVVLKKDVTIVRAGAPISREVAGLLTRLEIFPLEVGLELRALLDGSTLYRPELLNIDLDARRAEFAGAAHRALALAVEIGYASARTTPILLARAHRRAIALALAAGYPTKATVGALFGRALRAAKTLTDITGTPS